jgi:pyruvate dehydrogenase complex dehydrogenase (E1) component
MAKENVYEIENREWLDSLEYIIKNEGGERARDLLLLLQARAQDGR